jgi:hypothetical protein
MILTDALQVTRAVSTNLMTSLATIDSIDLAGDRMLIRDEFQPWVGGYSGSNGLKITAVTLGDRGGTIEVDASGQFLQYTPATGFEGIETFTYTIETADGLTDTATVTVRVGAVPDVTPPDVTPPDVTPPEVTLPEVTLATSFAGHATETETAPTELASPGRPSRVVAPPAAALASGAVARSGAFHSAREQSFGAVPAASFRSLDALNLSHLASFRAGQSQSTADLAFAELDAAEDGEKFGESDLGCLAGFLVGSAER